MKPDSPFHPLLAAPGPADLGPGPRSGVQALSGLNPRIGAALEQAGISGPRAELIRAALLLWQDQLDAAHTLAQAIENRDGSYLHAIMHRREPDYDNAKYWFRRVGAHPCFEELAARTAALLQAGRHSSLAARLLPGGAWASLAFVDECKAAADGAIPEADAGLLRQIQQVEFEVLIDQLVRKPLGRQGW
jgi:hypothetical protein